MATLNYTVLQGETFFDIASKLYADTPLGIQDIMSLNKISLDSALPSQLIYTPGLTRTIKKINVPQQANPGKPYVTRQGQNPFDIVIQLYGDFRQIANVIGSLPSLDQSITPGTMFNYPENESQASLLFRSILVATSGGEESFVLQETGFKITLEDGTGSILKE